MSSNNWWCHKITSHYSFFFKRRKLTVATDNKACVQWQWNYQHGEHLKVVAIIRVQRVDLIFQQFRLCVMTTSDYCSCQLKAGLLSVWRLQQQGSSTKPLECRGNKKSFQSVPLWSTSHQAAKQSKQALTLCRAEITWCAGLSPQSCLLRSEQVRLCASGAFSITDIWSFPLAKVPSFLLAFLLHFRTYSFFWQRQKKTSQQFKRAPGKNTLFHRNQQ